MPAPAPRRRRRARHRRRGQSWNSLRISLDTSTDSAPRLAAAFLDRGLLLRPLGNVVYFMPPYSITQEQTEWALEQIAAVL